METTGTVFNIQRFSVQDGFGVRTLVFLKGCPLHCGWCSNPESQKAAPQVLYQKNRCVHCRYCEEVCEKKAIHEIGGRQVVDYSLCDACGVCAENCYAGGLELSGKRSTVEEIFEEVRKDMLLYENSGGGVTLSGGEPFVQHEFARELLKICKKAGISTAVETCGCVGWDAIAEVLPYLDLFLFDIKQMDSEVHARVTGSGNEMILENLKKIVKSGKRVIVRLPIIPGVNDSMDHIRAVIDFMHENGIGEANILPFHKFGLNKYEALGREYAFKDASDIPDELLHEMRDAFENAGLSVTLFTH